MRFQHLVCLLLASLTYGQTTAPTTAPTAGTPAQQSAPAAPDKAPEVKIGPDDVVITLKGFCSDASLKDDACKTTITKAQFEKLAESLQPGMSPAIRRQLANRYGWILKMAAEAEKRGLDKQPTYEEKIYFARLQILSQELSSAMQADSGKISDADVEEYYKKNEANYDQATFNRIIVPRTKQFVPPAAAKPKPGAKIPPPPPPQTEAQKKAGEDAMTKLADAIRARAVKGEDPDKLQKEAYVAAGLKQTTVNTKLEKQRRSNMPKTHQAVMDLKPGEVSEVITDANSGHYIYVLVSKDTIPLETVAPEIRKTLSSQRYRDAMQGYQKDVDLNDAYFGATKNPAMPVPPRGAMPPADHMADPDK
ncbi:MAG: hypothetical protein ABSC07_01735 [Terriglobales bacterium]|jgi:hypothetical protein